jgi:hypothetical protein
LKSHRWTAASGFLFAVLFVVAMALLGEQLGSVGDPDRQFRSYVANESNRARDIAGAYVLVAAGIAFMLFSARASTLLAGDRDHQVARHVAFGAGIAVTGLVIAAAAALSAVSTSLSYAAMFDEERHEFGPDVTRLATQLGFMLLVLAMWAAATCIVALAYLARTAAGLPVLLFAVSLAAALALLLSFFVLPAAALPLWTVLLAIWLLGMPDDGVPSLQQARRSSSPPETR